MANPEFLWPTGAETRPGPIGTAPRGTTTPFPGVGGYGGLAGSVVGTAVPVPGAGLALGALGTGFDVHRANNQLESLGLPRSASFGPAAFNNASFGLFGNSARAQFEDAVTKAYPGLLAALTPAPTVEEKPASTPSLDYFGAINDMNNVGRLGEVFGAQDAGGAPQGPDVNTPGNSSEFGADGGDVYRRGGIVRDDGDGRLEPVRATLHETEGVIRPEVMAQIGARNFRDINRGGDDMRRALVRLLRSGQ